MFCSCGCDLEHRVIVVDDQLHCERCGYPLPPNDLRLKLEGRKIINGWCTYPGLNRGGF